MHVAAIRRSRYHNGKLVFTERTWRMRYSTCARAVRAVYSPYLFPYFYLHETFYFSFYYLDNDTIMSNHFIGDEFFVSRHTRNDKVIKRNSILVNTSGEPLRSSKILRGWERACRLVRKRKR